MPNRMDQRDAVIVHEFIDLGEEFTVMVDTHMFEHTNRDNAIEVPLNLAIVLEFEADPFAHTGTSSPASCTFILLPGQRDTNDLNVVQSR